MALGEGATRADVREECIAASSSAQDLRREAKLIAAREQLLACAREDCPKVIKQDCAQWLTEAEAATPTVVLGVHDERNEDIITAHVTVDGSPYLERLDGKATPIDPGVHKIHVEADGIDAADLELVIREGEKNRIVVISVIRHRADAVMVPKVEPKAPTSAPPPALQVAPVDSPQPVVDHRSAMNGRRWAAVAIAGTGLVAFGLGTWAGLDARSKADSARSGGCNHDLSMCPDSVLPVADQAYSRGNLATGAFVAGALLGTGAVILWLLAPTAAEPSQRIARWRLTPRLERNLRTVGVEHSF